MADQDVLIEIEIEAEPELKSERAALVRELGVALRKEKYEVESKRGDGDILGVIAHLAQNVQDNKEFLMVLFNVAKPIIQHLLKRREEYRSKDLELEADLEVEKQTFTLDEAKAILEQESVNTLATNDPANIYKPKVRVKTKIKRRRL